MNKYDIGLLVGRFNVFHIGHKSLSDLALTMCDRLLILVGSAQESGTLRNPFNVYTRMEMIRAIYPESTNVIIKPLPDLTTEDDITPIWGKYVLRNTYEILQKYPDAMIYGNDECRSGWFDPEDIKDMTEIVVSRSNILISATELRQLMVDNDWIKWYEYHSPELYEHYYDLRLELMNCADYKVK